MKATHKLAIVCVGLILLAGYLTLPARTQTPGPQLLRLPGHNDDETDDDEWHYLAYQTEWGRAWNSYHQYDDLGREMDDVRQQIEALEQMGGPAAVGVMALLRAYLDELDTQRDDAWDEYQANKAGMHAAWELYRDELG